MSQIKLPRFHRLQNFHRRLHHDHQQASYISPDPSTTCNGVVQTHDARAAQEDVSRSALEAWHAQPAE